MKKFAFSLEKLLQYKLQLLDSQKIIISLLVAEKDRALKKIDNLEKGLIIVKFEMQAIVSRGTTIDKINQNKYKIDNYYTQIKGLKNEIKLLEVKIDLQRDIVVAASKEVKSIEKLKEQKIEEYEHGLRKAEEERIGEYVMQKQFYSV